jgi:alkanesulfonate monooxygenase SsuD/methylene tetrahydromethanopterin reductase-like flavin-dependent oxidoreductase (luciferase family)
MTKPLEFGLLLHTRHLIRDGRPPSFDDLWEDAAYAEEVGFDHVWLGDSVTILDKARGDCLTLMAALSAKSQRIRIGTIPLLLALRNPVLLAHSLATLDVMSGGRIIIGASVAPLADYIRRQFIACGVPFHEKAGRLSESIELIRRLWTEDSFACQGRYYRFEEIGILPKPVQKPGIPIWLAAERSDNAFKRVARLGDGWFTTAPSLEKFKMGREKIEAYARDCGRAGVELPSALYASFNLNRDGDRARGEGWAWMEEFFRQPRSQLAHHFVLFGTPAQCADVLGPYVDAGLGAIVARMASSDQKAQMRLMLEELRPRLVGG